MGRSYSLCLVLIALSAGVVLGQGQAEIAPTLPAGARADFEESLRAFRARDQGECLAALERLRKKHPGLPPARLMLGRMFLAHGQLGPTRQNFEIAASEAPGHPEIYLAFGALAVNEGRMTDALVHLERAAATARPSNWPTEQVRKFDIEVASGLAIVFESRQDWRSAVGRLSRLDELDPKNAMTLQRLARARFRQEEVSSATELLRQARKADPQLPPADIALAGLYAEVGDRAKSRQLLEQGMQAHPDDPHYARELAAVFMMQGEDKSAMEMVRRAQQLGDKSKELRMTFALVARRTGRLVDAITSLESIRREEPTDFETANQLALALIASNDQSKRQAALRLAESNARLFPGRGDALSTLGWVYFQLGRQKEGENILRASASKGQVRTETAYYLARVLAKTANKADAEAARNLLRNLMKQPGLFILRPEAEKWLEENPGPRP